MIISYDKNPRLTEDEKLDSLSRSVQLALNEKADKDAMTTALAEKADRDTVAETYIKASDVIDLVYPIGSYYETDDQAFDPNTSWGGTWVLEAEGLVHVSAGQNYSVGDTGGEATHTLTVDEMPNHHHTLSLWNNGQHYSPTSGNLFQWYSSAYGQQTANTSDVGGGQPHNNMQPYIVVNRWHRTA